MAQPAELKL